MRLAFPDSTLASWIFVRWPDVQYGRFVTNVLSADICWVLKTWLQFLDSLHTNDNRLAGGRNPIDNMFGGLVAMNFIFPYDLGSCHHPNWRTPSFFRGVGFKPPNHQPILPLMLVLSLVYPGFVANRGSQDNKNLAEDFKSTPDSSDGFPVGSFFRSSILAVEILRWVQFCLVKSCLFLSMAVSGTQLEVPTM